MAVDDDAQRILARLREAPLLMPYLHYSVSIDVLLRVLSGDQARTRAALAVLVQRRDAEYLENCSPDHFRAFAVMAPMPSVTATEA